MAVHHHRNMPGAFHGRRSRVYDLMARKVFRRMYRRLARDFAKLAPHGGEVLDIGTGPGVLLLELARLRPDLRLVGIDLSADMIQAAERNLSAYRDRASVRVGDATDLPFADGSFDAIVSSLSLHHWDHPEAAAPELARVLRQGGKIYIYDFRFAPFDALSGVLTGHAESTRIRAGIPLFPALVRHVVA